MSRTTILIILGFGTSLMAGLMAIVIGGSYLMANNRTVEIVTPLPLVVTTAVAENNDPTATPTTEATAVVTTATAVPTISPTATVQSGQGSICTDAATFISDVSVPDGTVMTPVTGFNKIWRIKNSGSCTWSTSYQLIHAGGHLLEAVSTYFPLRDTVLPGQTVDLTINMVSPAVPGSYQSDWKLQNAQGTPFGIGANNNAAFWVKIVVASPTAPASGSLSGFAWQDKDRDNVVDANEMLPDVTITLAAGADCRTVIGSLKTDGNGRFSFNNLVANSYCLSGTDGSTTVSQSNIVLAANQHLSDVKITWPPVWPQLTTISGLIYQDANQNGMYDNGETLMGDRKVQLVPGTACHVQQEPYAVAFSGNDGRYTLAGEYNGSYCVGVVGDNGLNDVIGITVTAGQTVNNINLKWPAATGSISGYLWNDYCFVRDNGSVLDGNCVADGNGGYRADGMIQPTESTIAGVTISLQLGGCAQNNNVVVTAVTNASGRYSFGSLQPATYCIFMNAAVNGNAEKLLPGDWTFPQPHIWYHQITVQANENVAPVNFGWDYQLQ